MLEDNSKVEFLYLSEEDLIKAGVLDMNQCVEIIDEMFKVIGQGDYLMGGPRENEHGIMLWFPTEKRFDKMPTAGPDRRFMSLISYLGGRFNVCGEKWYGSNVENKNKGLPRSILTVTLNDVETGQPLAYMSGNLISAMRTGAVPGVATRYLASEKAKNVAVVGTGVINKACLLAITYAKPDIELIKVFDVELDRSKKFKDEMEKEINIEIQATNSLEECIVDSDIVSVATSGPNKPKIKDEWIKDGCLITLTGTAELSPSFYKENYIVADNWKMHEAWYQDGLEHPSGLDSITSWAPTGDLIKLVHDERIDSKKIANLGDISLGKVKGRQNNKDKIVLVTGGLSTEDTAWAYHVYKKAKEQGIGQTLKLWDQPYWS
jgi:N-[(2S)-2-amino-2-carboxyethyl]-L-glutamate dehydrogenase